MLGMNDLSHCALDAIPTVAANISHGLASLAKALREKTTVHRAMYREGLGWVDFEWGDEGKWPPNAKGRRKGEKGLSHAIEARRRKDGLSPRQTLVLLRKMVEAIAEGKEIKRDEVPPSMKVIVGLDGTIAHLVKRTGGNAWVLTVYYDDEGGKDAQDAVSGAFQPTHSGPTPCCAEMGALTLAAGANLRLHTLTHSMSGRRAGADDTYIIDHIGEKPGNTADEPLYTQFRHDAQAAIAFLKKEKRGIAVAALYHPEIGDIDLVWGKTSDNSRAKGTGIAKIVDWHSEAAHDLQGFILSLHVHQRHGNKIHLTGKGGKRAAVQLDYNGKTRNWLLTAYVKGKGKNGILMDSSAAHQTTGEPDSATSPNTVIVSIALFDTANDLLTNIENASHAGDFGQNPRRLPTAGQLAAGNYKKGRVDFHGLPLAIEQPRGTYRTGTDKSGQRWSSFLAANYGYVAGTKGADGDPVDCFVGVFPDADHAYVVNQYVNGRFDEHKIMLGFPDEQCARNAYLDSFERGWDGLKSIIPATLTQLQWWLKNGDLSRPLQTDYLPYAGLKMSQKIWWTQDANPETFTFDQILYRIRCSVGGELVLDRITLGAIYEDSDGVLAFDALVTPYMQLERKMNVLQGLMNRASPNVQIVAQQISQPFMQRGTANVAVVWELSDGQTISVFLHNPDVTPKKIAPTDELISWKWLLNKKDITLVVAPEHGEDLNPREVAKRIMRLADKNGAAFARANAKRADTMQTIDGLKTEIASLEGELSIKQNRLEALKVEAESETKPKPQPQPEPELKTTTSNENHEVFLSYSDGYWNLISGGQPLTKNVNYEDAWNAAIRLNLTDDLSHGRVWNGDKAEWTFVQPIKKGDTVKENDSGLGYVGTVLDVYVGPDSSTGMPNMATVELPMGRQNISLSKLAVVKGEKSPSPQPKPIKAKKPVTPTPQPTEDPQKAADRSLFQSVIDGTVPNILDPALADLLETAYLRNESDPALIALAEKALDAYSDAGIKADQADQKQQAGTAVTTDAIPPDATAAALTTLAPYIGQAQLTAITQGVIGDEQEFYQAKVAQLAQLINTMPEMPWLEGKGETSLAYLHYFDDNGDWYITERDRQATQTQAFGLANPDGTIGAMGNIDISQLTGEGAELDLDWEPVMVETVNGFPAGQESTPIQLDGVPKIPPCPLFAKGGVLDGINTVQGPSGNPERAADQALFNAILAGDLTGTLDQGVAERLEAAWYRSVGDEAMMALGTQAMAAYAAANGQAGRSLKAGQVVDDSSTIVPDRLVIAKGIEDEAGIAKPDSQTDPDINGNGTDSKGVKPGDNAKFDDAKPVDPADAANQGGKLDPDKSPDGQEAPDVQENAKNDGDQAKDDGNGEVANDVGKKFDSADGLPAIYPDSRPTPPDSPAVGSEQLASEIAVTKASQKKGEEWVGRPEYGSMFDAGDPTSPKEIPPNPPLVKGEVLDSAGLGAALGNELGVNWMFDVGLTWIDRPAYSGLKGSDDPPSAEVGKTTEGDEEKEAEAVDEGEKQAELPKGDASTAPIGVELDSVVLDGANDMHWITTKKGNHLLIQGNPKKGFKVRSGAGGKFNGQKWKPTKLTKALPAKPYHEMTRQEFHEAHENMPVKREGHQTRKEALDAKHLSHIHEAAKSGKAIPGHVVEDMMKRAIA